MELVSYGQEIPCLLCDPKVHKIRPLDRISARKFQPTLLPPIFNIIFPYSFRLRLPSGLFSVGFQLKILHASLVCSTNTVLLILKLDHSNNKYLADGTSYEDPYYAFFHPPVTSKGAY
jgi:hypothetical protein